ncbi:ATP-binding protein [Tepidibacillus marianensis]|uniref:ATP-binding protein n=1 Tax=Tepidibacillus marianensis TaxID=3131995 RepID=UPI0030CE9080
MFIGNFGTGKSHLSIALGEEAINQGYKVKYYTAAHLSNELMEAQDELLFQFFSARYERGSMIITSNREFSRWIEVFHDEQMTAALLDRVTHEAHIIPMNGESYRLKETYSK